MSSLPIETPVQPSASLPRLPHSNQHQHHFLKSAAATGCAALSFSFLLLLLFLWRKLTRRRNSSPNPTTPCRLPHSLLRKATESFAPRNLLGRGGFGSVYKGFNPSLNFIAVKVMDSGSLQGEREFQNELFFAEKIKKSEMVVTAIGFSHNSQRRRMLLVYHLMQNGNLQDALLHRKCKDLMNWKKRFAIAIDIAKGIEYLHSFDPSIVHGDIKPSNILLDGNFRARIGDFGLARLKSKDPIMEKQVEVEINGMVEDSESVVEESASTITGFDDFHPGIEHSVGSLNRVDASVRSPEVVQVLIHGLDAVGRERITSPLEGDVNGVKQIRVGIGNRNISPRQDNGEEGSGVVKNYVMDWIGKEVNEGKPNSDWIGTSLNSNKFGKKKSKKKPEWWASMDDDKIVKKEKRRPPREWWKEEFCEELARKKKNKGKTDACGGEDWWPRGVESSMDGRKKKWRNRSRSSRSSVDWWFEGLSGELWRNRHRSFDSDIPKSGGISSTPSMRGTVCYVAPECGGDTDVSEKCDVYSFGVLLLVLVAGRRPLQVSESPLSEFQRANLISWARHLARAGRLLDLVDQSIESLDQEEALLCITVALICLQKSPARRPSMKEVVGMLCGDLQHPQLPVEYSPSPPPRFPLKRQKNG